MSPDRRLLARHDHEEVDRITAYVMSQGPKAVRVKHVEHMTTHSLMGERYEVWDVHTKRDGRWWIVEPVTNLYSQKMFPGMDQVFTFHLGLMQRLMAHYDPAGAEREQGRLPVAWRKWQAASRALDSAVEAEDIQTVGVKLRETLLALVKAVATPDMVPAGGPIPKTGDFLEWSERIANAVAPGDSADNLRSHLKGTARTTWQLVASLTHAQGATPLDGLVAVAAVRHLLGAFVAAVLRHESGQPYRCPECGSYRLAVWLGADGVDPITCESCGWQQPPEEEPLSHR